MDSENENKVNNILFVDNDSAVNIALQELLAKKKNNDRHFFNVTLKKNAKEALEELKKNKTDLIIMEIALPMISGYYLIDAIHKHFPNTSIIIYTRLKRPQDLAKMASKKVSNIILKELVDIKQLINEISDQKKVENIDETVLRLNDQIKALMGTGIKQIQKLTQCPRCHLIVPPDSQFCHNCGQKITRKPSKKLIQITPNKKGKETK